MDPYIREENRRFPKTTPSQSPKHTLGHNNNWITNEQLYERARQKPWSNTIATRRLRVFGHICRLPNSAPAKKALYEGLRQSKKPRGGQRRTLLKLIEKQLAEKNRDIYRAIRLAQDRKAWRIMIVM